MPNKKLGLIAILVSVAAGEIWAGTLSSYAVGDVLLCFRKSGGANGLVVDAGPISTFTNATLNQRIPITQYTGGQLAAALSATNGVSWSAFTWFDDSVNPNWTVCMTRARTVLNTQTAPWLAASAGSQQYLITTELATIPLGANDNFSVVLYNTNSTSTAVIEPDSSTGNTSGNYPDGQSYHSALDPTGFGDNNFGGFPGNPENTTTNNFTTAGKVARSDFYWIPPTGSGAVKYLGYFELNTNGVMTYVAYPASAPTAPVISSFGRTNNLSYVSFTTGSGGTYTLRGTNDAGLSTPRINWPAISSVSGNGSINTLQDTTAVPDKFYIITAQ
jgi:hypothetical protein